MHGFDAADASQGSLRTRDLSSYSLGSIALANTGNAVHSVSVFHLQPGPIWFLHTSCVASSAPKTAVAHGAPL